KRDRNAPSPAPRRTGRNDYNRFAAHDQAALSSLNGSTVARKNPGIAFVPLGHVPSNRIGEIARDRFEVAGSPAIGDWQTPAPPFAGEGNNNVCHRTAGNLEYE